MSEALLFPIELGYMSQAICLRNPATNMQINGRKWEKRAAWGNIPQESLP